MNLTVEHALNIAKQKSFTLSVQASASAIYEAANLEDLLVFFKGVNDEDEHFYGRLDGRTKRFIDIDTCTISLSNFTELSDDGYVVLDKPTIQDRIDALEENWKSDRAIRYNFKAPRGREVGVLLIGNKASPSCVFVFPTRNVEAEFKSSALVDFIRGLVPSILKRDQELSSRFTDIRHELKPTLTYTIPRLEAILDRKKDIKYGKKDWNTISSILDSLQKRFEFINKIGTTDELGIQLDAVLAFASASRSVRKTKINIGSIIEDTIEEMLFVSDIKPQYDSSIHAKVEISEQNFRSIIEKIVDNAAKYALPNQKARPVLRISWDNKKKRLSFENDGERLNQEDAEELLSRGVRGPSADDHPGTGLGLYHVSEICRIEGCKFEYKVYDCPSNDTLSKHEFTIAFDR